MTQCEYAEISEVNLADEIFTQKKNSSLQQTSVVVVVFVQLLRFQTKKKQSKELHTKLEPNDD